MTTMPSPDATTIHDRSITLRNVRGDKFSFDGYVLGSGSTQMPTHNHPPGLFQEKGRACTGCRWSETKIYWSSTNDCYVVYTVGRSIVPGEVDRGKVVYATTADDIIDTLIIPPKRDRPNQDPIPPASQDAIDEAAENDTEIEEAFEKYLAED